MRSNRNVYGRTDTRLHELAASLGTPSVEQDVGLFLRFYCSAAKPGKILEIGCGIGVSTCYMSEGFPDAQITAIDHNRVRLEQAKEVTKELKNVTLVCRTAVDFLRETDEKYDLIFIDSVKKEYPILFYLAEKQLKPGGAIIFDDVFVYGYIFCEDCEIPDKFRPLAQIFREFLDRIKNTGQHSILPIGGGVLLFSRG